jgi:hypothetical protein
MCCVADICQNLSHMSIPSSQEYDKISTFHCRHPNFVDFLKKHRPTKFICRFIRPKSRIALGYSTFICSSFQYNNFTNKLAYICNKGTYRSVTTAFTCEMQPCFKSCLLELCFPTQNTIDGQHKLYEYNYMLHHPVLSLLKGLY